MEKHHPWFFVCHVLVDSNNVDRLQFVFCDREISIDNGVIIGPSKGRQVFTPMSLSIFTPCVVAGRPIVNLTIPSFDSPCTPKISLSGPAEIELFSGSEAPPTPENDSAGFAR